MPRPGKLRRRRGLGGVGGALWHLCAVWFVSGDGVAEPSVCQSECVLPWTGRGHRDFDPPHAHADQRTDLQQLQPDCTAGCLSKLRVGQPDATQGAEQHVSHRGKPQAELVGLHGRGRGAVGEQVELA